MGARMVDEETIRRWIAEGLANNPSPGGSSYLPLDLTDDVEVALNGFSLEYVGTKIKEEHDDATGTWYAEDLVNHGQYYLDGAVGTTYTQSGDPDYVGPVGLFYTHPGGLAQMYSQADEDNWAQLDVTGPNIHAQAVGTFKIEADEGFLHSAPTSTPAALLTNGQISFYLDEVGNKLKVAVKYSDGTSKTGEIALT
jgi:hypothetical protein